MNHEARRPHYGGARNQKPFAIRVVRLLTKAAIATELGPEVCWLLTVVAHTQDARHYAGPVNFWNEQLMPLCGFGGKGRLVAARNKAIAHGWLEYSPGGKGRAGCYEVVIPPEYERIPDGPSDGGEDLPYQNGTANGREISRSEGLPYQNSTPTGRQPDGNRTANAPLPTYTYTYTDSSCSELSEKASEPNDAAPGFGPFPCVGDRKEWHLTAPKLAEWSESFPHLDVAAELRKARQWLLDNPERRKTYRGIVRFLNGWLSRAQDSGRGMQRGADPKPGTLSKPIPPVRR